MANGGWWSRKGDGADLSAIRPLRARVSAGLIGRQDARTHLDSLFISNSKIWSAPQALQTTALGWWMMQMSWEIANVFIEGVAASSPEDAVPNATYKAGEQLCKRAEEASVLAIRNHSQVEVNLGLAPMKMQPFPQLPKDIYSCAGVWAAYEAVYLQVQTDKSRILGAQVPQRFRPVMERLVQMISPSVALFEYCQNQWLVAMTPEDKLRVVVQASEHAEKLFEAGQMFWAPYFLGGLYTQCQTAKPTLDELDLGFDPWAITDYKIRELRRNDAKSLNELIAFWMANPNPMLAYRLFTEVEEAMARREVRWVTGNAFPYCPWAPMWLAWKDVTLAGRKYPAGTYFSVYAGKGNGGKFVCEIQAAGRFELRVSARRR